MNKKNSIYDYVQLEAVAGGLVKSDIAFFRKVCRWYSTTFHTPLHEVMDCKVVQWDDILLHYYEDQMEDLPFNSLYEIACREYIPELAEEFDKENEEYAASLVEEQQRTVERKKKKDEQKQVLKTAPSASVNKTEEVVQNKEMPKPVNLSFDDEEDV